MHMSSTLEMLEEYTNSSTLGNKHTPCYYTVHDVHCEVGRNHSGDFVEIKWKQNRDDGVILHYQIIWNCSDSDHYHMVCSICNST